jgi:hypothetical protein
MIYNGSNKRLNSNPEDLHGYRKKQHHGNTTPVGVEQSTGSAFFNNKSPFDSLPIIRDRLFAKGDEEQKTNSQIDYFEPYNKY